MGKPWLERRGTRLILSIHLQPQATRDEIAGRHGDSLKLRIRTAPIDGKANDAARAFLAAAFGTSKAQVKLLRGEKSRTKRFAIEAATQEPGWLDVD